MNVAAAAFPALGLAARARDWAVWLTRQPSVTGSPGEQALPAALAARAGAAPAFAAAERFLIPAGDRLGRQCCAMLLRGEGPDTVLLTGHFDTVTTEDYGELAPLATDPEALLPALRARLAHPATAAEMLAAADFDTGDFLPGRGLLDMKAGLAAGLAAMEGFASRPRRRGNILFVAVPDEEVNSVGARALARALPQIEAERGIKVRAAVNLDCIGDLGDGSEGRAVALGSVGKLLLTALVMGQQSHASHPYQGVNAGAIAAAIAARMEWAPELADATGAAAGIPPTLLSMRDGKEQYDVTTPASVFATWNTLTTRRDALTTMRIFRRIVRRALDGLERDLQSRRARIRRLDEHRPDIALLDAAELFGGLAGNAAAQAEIGALAGRLALEGHNLPEQNRRLTEAAWRLTGRRGPGVVIGFGSLPYPAVQLRRGPRAQRFLAAIYAARARASAVSGQSIKITSFFPGISDVSFIGEAVTRDVASIAANTPAWSTGVVWGGEVGGVPTVNIGPWGRDYHTPLERLHAPYAFGVLPGLLLDICATFLEEGA